MPYSTPSLRLTNDLIAAGEWNQNTVNNAIALRGGEIALTSQAVGDLVIATSATQLGRVADVATGQVLVSGGVSTAPTYSASPSITALTYTEDLKSTTALATPAALTATQATVFASTVSGAAIMGHGTTNDVSLMNRAGTVVLGVGPNTTAVNIPGTLTISTALTVPNGGTGVATQQAYGVLVGGTTATGVMQSITPGTSGYVLTSAGTGALPTWSAGRATETAAQTSNYTLALTDDGLVVLMNVTGSSTLTVPPNSAVAFASGTVITVYNMSASNCVITAGSGVTIRNLSNGVVSQYGEISMRKRDTNEWVLVGAVT